jgi:anaerobic ribonucleoside-triphosphate reductase activating protein
MRVMNIIHDSIVDGPGLRTTLFLAGCPHACLGCHNPSSWYSSSGTKMKPDDVIEDILSNSFNDVTFSGGDPLIQSKELIVVAKALKKAGKNIWCYTGYLYEDILASNNKYMKDILNYIDVLVDGRFELDKKDLTLPYAGSYNQRLINVSQSLLKNTTILWEKEIAV